MQTSGSEEIRGDFYFTLWVTVADAGMVATAIKPDVRMHLRDPTVSSVIHQIGLRGAMQESGSQGYED
ncbi:MAG TPA: hypothetical protein VGN16_08380 [Acidobacteriaceae bacterium]|jgi:hypothetical protein